MLEFLRNSDPKSRTFKFFQAEIDLDTKLLAAESALANAEAAAADDALVAALGESTAGSAALIRSRELRAETAALSKAIGKARAERAAAISALWTGEAVILRKRATEKRTQAEKRQKKTDALLAQLKEHEVCDFEPAHQWRVGALSYEQKSYPAPLTERIRAQAAELETQALQLESRKPPMDGSVSAGDVDGLLHTACGDFMRIGPTRQSIRSWVAKCQSEREAKQARLRPQQDTYGLPIRFLLAWRDGAIVEGASHWEYVRPEPVKLKGAISLAEWRDKQRAPAKPEPLNAA